MSSRIAPLFLVAFVAYATAADVASGWTESEIQSHGEIRAHGVDGVPRHSSKRMMRKQPASSVTEVEVAEQEDDLHLGRLLAETRLAFPVHGHQASLLQGPGTLPPVDDPFSASIENMLKFDQNLSFDCSVSYGRRMLQNLLEARNEHHVCAGHNSSVVCHERVPFDVSRYTCELNNVMISSDGTAAPGCTKNAYDSWLSSAGITEHNIFGKSTVNGGLNIDNKPLGCFKNSSAKALVQVAADVQNFYEWYGDWVTLWETMAALKWHPEDVDLYLVGKISGEGKHYVRPFDEAWVRMFKNRLHVGSMDELFGSGICFKQIVTVPQGSLSTMSFRGGRGGSVGCASPLVMSSALYLQSLFPFNATSDGKKHVTVLMRKPGMRQWDNNVMVIRDIQDVVPKDWTVSGYYPEDMPSFESQLQAVQNTQIFVGIHGAGMMHVLFLPPMARVVEVFCGDRPMMNHHFRNLEEMGEPFVGEHLFHYYFESTLGRCKVDPKVIKKAVAAYDAGPVTY
mmetsp:Transcript_92551/g.177706  ORF Transcript_92551/g.177706 Transcript_92551/m.177706 type:complete len:510 (-) Transcript_92551:23-1552(-)